MALSDVIKKKQETGPDKEANKEKKNPLDDVRLVIAILIIACIAIIVMIVFGTKSINSTKAEIESAKTKYSQNQASIANLKALQSKSSEYEAQRDEYQAMISSDPLDQQEIMKDMEEEVEAHNCSLTEVTFGEQSSANGVNQIQVNIKVTGNFADVMKFCYDTVHGEQIKRIDTIKMESTNKTSTSSSKTSKSSSSSTDGKKTVELVIVLFSTK